jgi:hypothetical protein
MNPEKLIREYDLHEVVRGSTVRPGEGGTPKVLTEPFGGEDFKEFTNDGNTIHLVHNDKMIMIQASVIG